MVIIFFLFIQSLEIGAVVREKQLSFRGESAVLDDDGYLSNLASHSRIKIGVFSQCRSGARQNA